jgi:hypothetical protein
MITLGFKSQQKIDVTFLPDFMYKNECGMLISVLHFSSDGRARYWPFSTEGSGWRSVPVTYV